MLNVESYIRNRGEKCPECRGDVTHRPDKSLARLVTMVLNRNDPGSAYMLRICPHCNMTWEEQYAIAGFRTRGRIDPQAPVSGQKEPMPSRDRRIYNAQHALDRHIEKALTFELDETKRVVEAITDLLALADSLKMEPEIVLGMAMNNLRGKYRSDGQ